MLSLLKSNLDSLSKNADIVMIQESRVATDSKEYRTILQPHWLCFKNPNPASPNSAGTDIFVHNQFASMFRIKLYVIIAGHIQALTFIPLRNADCPFSKSFTIINLYLPSGNSKMINAARLLMLSRLQETIPGPTRYVFSGGDWNLTEYPSDSNSPDHFASSTEMRSALTRCLQHFNGRGG